MLYLCNARKNINFRDDITKRGIGAFDKWEQIVSIGAWVLMPNHFHIYVSPRVTLGETGVSLFMNKLSTGYSMYFNKKYKRTGALYEGRFKAVRVESDEQAKYNFSYIHLNPIKLIDPSWKENGIQNIKKALEFLDTYKWNSYLDYKGSKRPENKIISFENFPDYFSDKKVVEEEIVDWLNYNEKLPLGPA